MSVEGQLLGLADRIQTIVAMFGIGNAPTGSKDPFALRRAANAIVKILAEAGLPLTIGDVLSACPQGPRKIVDEEVKDEKGKTVERSQITISSMKPADNAEVAAFLRERVQFYLKDVRGFAYDVVNAVMAVSFDDVRDAIARAEAQALLETANALFSDEIAGPEAKKRYPLLPTYELALKCSNLFNLLDARGAISVTERVGVIGRILSLIHI